jgi:hypothetical protein
MDTENQRPAVWVGHVAIHTDVIAKSCEFMLDIGMRPIMQKDDFALLELRGGTHLALVTDQNSTMLSGSFDLMVDDLDAMHAHLVKLGYQPGEIERGNIHDSFEIRDPGGTMLTVNSSHVSDQPV